MKRILAAGLLALMGLGLAQSTATADYCFHVYKPCLKFPVPPIPIICPSFKFFCESCNHGCCPCPGGPWYAQFPNTGAPMGYSVAPYGGFTGSVYGGGFGSYGQPAYGYAAPAQNNPYTTPTQMPAPAWNGYYTSQSPYYWNNQ